MWINIVLLGIVSFITDVSSELIHPILPMFIIGLGGTSIVIGLVGGLRDAIASVLNVFGGFWADKIGKRKIFVVWGYSISSLFKILIPFSSLSSHVLVFSSIERIGKGLRTAPRDAIIADSIPEKRGKGFGIHRALDSLGAILGSILCFVLFWEAHFELKQIMLIGGGIGFAALVPLYFVKETYCNTHIRTELKGVSKEVRLFILISSIFALGNFSYMFFLLRAKDFFASRWAIGGPIALYTLFNIFYTVSAIPFGVLSDCIGRKWVIVIGYFLFAITCIGFIFSNSIAGCVVLFALYGLAYACITGNQRAFISDLAPPQLKATALGAFHTTIGIVALPASLIAGALWQINPNISFGFAGTLTTVAALLLLGFKKLC